MQKSIRGRNGGSIQFIYNGQHEGIRVEGNPVMDKDIAINIINTLVDHYKIKIKERTVTEFV